MKRMLLSEVSTIDFFLPIAKGAGCNHGRFQPTSSKPPSSLMCDELLCLSSTCSTILQAGRGHGSSRL